MESGHSGMESGHSGMESGHSGMESGHSGMESGHSGMESGHSGMESGHSGMESGSGFGSGSGGEIPIELPEGSGSGEEIPIEHPSTESPLEITEDGEQPLELIEEEYEEPLELEEEEEEGEVPVEIPENECCSEKTVGGIHYYLVGTGETEVYNCLDNCIYHSANPRDVWQYCFRPGRQPVQCNDATVTPAAGHHHPTPEPMMDHGNEDHGMVDHGMGDHGLIR